jgi:hypothetical protein
MSRQANFFGEVNVRAIKFFFEQTADKKENLFNMTISIWDENTLVFYEHYPLYTYY